jgi:hypothetical protein
MTLTYDGSGTYGAGWYGTASYSYPGYCGCSSASVSVTSILIDSGTGHFSYKEYVKMSGSCPAATGFMTFVGIVATSAYPSLSFTFHGLCQPGDWMGRMYGGSTTVNMVISP